MRPLSVAADRIAAVAMRGAGLLGALAACGAPVDRAGGGMLIETYPAAALRQWGLPYQGYKGPRNLVALDAVAAALLRGAPWLDPADHDALLRRSDDAFDAVVCALVARAAAAGAVSAPSGPGQTSSAGREGWIVLPAGPLGGLAA